MMHVREAHNPADFEPEPATLNAWTDPKVPDSEAVPFLLRTGCLYGSVKRVRDQVAELSDVGVQHLLCQTGFGAMSHDQNLGLDAAVWRAGHARLRLTAFSAAPDGRLPLLRGSRRGACRSVRSCP